MCMAPLQSSRGQRVSVTRHPSSKRPSLVYATTPPNSRSDASTPVAFRDFAAKGKWTQPV